jgi:hypothetical protein
VDRIERGVAEARTAGDAPEIDGVVRFKWATGSGVRVGEFATVKISGASEYDLEATWLAES